MNLFTNGETLNSLGQQIIDKYCNRSMAYMMLIVILLQSGCRKFVEVGTPPDKITQSNVFSNDKTAITVLTTLYGSNMYTGTDMAKYCGLLTDEFSLWSGADLNHFAYYTNFLSSQPTSSTGIEIWNSFYSSIFTCNSAIEGLSVSSNLSPYVKKQLLGEAHFMRAWFYFYLVNLYGDLPLAVGIDPDINSLLSRSPKELVYQQIINDLSKAQELLNTEYVNGQLIAGTQERVRPTKWAADALLARVYLYTREYAKAELEASKVIGHSTSFSLLPCATVFLKNSREAIWQLQPIDLGFNTQEARTFHLSTFPQGFSNAKPVYISSFLLNAFDAHDQRRTQWVDSWTEGGSTYYFPAKYKVAEENGSVNSPETMTEYSMMLRLSEQYLIRAEARAKLNNLSGAIADLDLIRNRANLPLIANINPSISQSDLLVAILNERQVELFSEWGHRWFDLKRTGKIDAVMNVVTPTKEGTWESTDQLLPIPYDDLLYGPNLIQNPGYSK